MPDSDNKLFKSVSPEGTADKVSEAVAEFAKSVTTTGAPNVKRRSAKSYFDTVKPRVPQTIKNREKSKLIQPKASSPEIVETRQQADIPFLLPDITLEFSVKTSEELVVVELAPPSIEIEQSPQWEIILPPEIALERRPEFVDHQTIPETYQQTFVTLLARDPYWIYAYWEIAADAIEQLKAIVPEGLEGGVYTLRVYDVTLINFDGKNANNWFDLDELFMKNRYINVPHDNATYCAEIGVRTPDGKFRAMAQSNVTVTPPVGPSVRTDLIWKEKMDDLGEKTYTDVNGLKEKMRKRTGTRVNWQINTRRITLSPRDIKQYYTQRISLRKIIGQHLKDFDANLADIYSAGVLGQEGVSHLEQIKDKSKAFLGASDLWTGKETFSKEEGQFPFELETELIVRGRTAPGAQVTLGSKKIKLDSSGRFELTFKLQDGALPLDFTAISLDRRFKKSIKTSVIRTKTAYDM